MAIEPIEFSNFSQIGGLLRLLTRHFNLEELKNLCFRLGVQYDELRGDTLSSKARELILYMQKQKRLEALWAEMVLANASLEGQRPQTSKGSSPYKGIYPFTKDDQHNFFGRDDNIAELVE